MKKQTITETFIYFLLAAFLLIGGTVSAQQSASIPQNVQVKQLASIGDKLTFEVQVRNDLQQRFRLMVKDEDGTQLWSQLFSDKDLNQRFVLDGFDADRKVILVVRPLNSQQTQSFEISRNTRVVEDYVVTKL